MRTLTREPSRANDVAIAGAAFAACIVASTPARADGTEAAVRPAPPPAATAPLPLAADPHVAAVLLDRSLSYYGSEARDRRLWTGRVAFAEAALMGSLGAFTLDNASSRNDRVTGWVSVGLGGVFLAGAVVANVKRSELERLADDYAAWRKDTRVPEWQAVQRATARWSEIAEEERTARRWTGSLTLVAGVLGGIGGVYNTASAKDDRERATAFTMGLESLVLLATGAALLSSEGPAEAGWHAWSVYVQPLPDRDAWSRSASFCGATIGATTSF